MNDSVTFAMRVVETFEKFGAHMRGHGGRQSGVGNGQLAAKLIEGWAVDVLHGDEIALVDHA